MKKRFILTPLIGILLYLSLSSHYYGPAYGGTGDRTGASGTASCAGLGCHGTAATTSTTVTVQLLSGSTAVTSYVPGTVYTLKIHGVNTGTTTLPNFGFQMAVVKSSGAGTTSAVSTGTFGTAPASTHTYAIPSTSLTVFEHYNATYGDGSLPATTGSGGSGTTYDVTIPWTAPAAGTGSVVLYGILNAVNHDSASGTTDLWNSATPVTICESPAAITGTMTVCAGATTTLSDATTGGTWSSGSTGVATVGSTGIVTGVSGGTAVISYTTSCASVTATVTVNAVSPGNTVVGGGPAAVCQGATITLSNINPGGTWSSASTGVATVTGGTVSGITSGTAVISYTLPSTGCAATTRVTVNATPTISGSLSTCIGGSTTLTGSPSGGSWSTSSSIINIGSATGSVAGVSSGTATITYTSLSGCTKTATFTVNAPAAPIGGTASVCQGGTTTLTDITPGGSWTSGTTSVATIISSGTAGIVTGVTTGSTSPATSIITYLPPTGCSVSVTLTVNPVPGAISPGSPTVCQGVTTTLSDATPGGTWGSGSTGIATVGSTGIVTGVSGGTAVISYTSGVGCSATTTVTVNPAPPAITGTLTLCPGATDTLHDAVSGSWTSATTSVASIDPVTGIVTGISGPGTSVITFFDGTTACPTTATVTVNASAAPITGTLSVCQGATTTLSNASGSGTWSSAATGTATVTSPGSSTTVTGVAPGTVLISYVPSSGCGATATVTVNPLPGTISGPTSVCMGSTITLTDASTGGSWSSGATGVATVGSSTGIITPVSPGTATISYTLPSGCSSSVTITVNALPTVAPISGTLTVCSGSTTTLSDATASGVWSSSAPTVATIGSSSGVVTGISITTGTSVIVYTVTSSAGCSASSSAVVTVNPIPAAITGTASVCAGSTRTLNETTISGTWSSSSTGTATVTPSGLSTTVTGVAAGTTTISYTLSTGCSRTIIFTVNALPAVGAITGTTNICQGNTSTLADTTAGGVWSTSSSAVAPIGSSSGIVTGSSLGTATISYTVTSSAGCVARATTPVTVNAQPAIIGGLSTVCTGASISLTDATTGGTWSSSATSVATVGSTGSVTGISAGTTTISYTMPSGCFAVKSITVNTTPVAISGTATVCAGQTTTLTDATTGGTWSSSTTSQATVGSTTGIVTGVASGTPTITYSIGGCFATARVTVNPLSSISGLSSACAGATTTLTDATTGGTWSSATTSVATIGSASGIASAVATGTSVISYSLPTGCVATMTFTVISSPSPISGTNHVCLGATTTLSDAGGGTWTSSAPATASVGSATGIVTGVTTGTVTITYSLGTGCTVTTPVTVNPLPSGIGGTTFAVCPGASITLTDATTGGSWSSASTNVTVGSSTGSVTGVTAGTATITYTSSFGCNVTRTVTVNAAPAAISGPGAVCASATITMTDATTGGTWSSSPITIATISSGTGVVNGVAAGIATISYTLSGTGCATTTTITVNTLPAAISGTTHLCAGGTTTLSNATTGGTWSAAPSTTITIGSASGVVTGVAAGTGIITYSLATGCLKTATVTVNPLPTAFAVTGGGAYCAGGAGVHIGIASSQSGVNYQLYTGSTPVGVPVAGTGGPIDFGFATTAGTYTITATNSTSGCTATMTGTVGVTVNPLPAAITGTASVCRGLTTTLSDATTGGTWSSGASATATAGSATGIITGVAAGTATITYTNSVTGCFVTDVVTVNPLPSIITGASYVCMGSTATLSDTLTGGTWTSGTAGIATIGSASGVVSPVAPGVDTITYTLPTGCLITGTITVNALPVAGTITGASSVCVSSTISLTDTTAGGIWSSSNTSLATVGTTGIVTGLTAGTDTIMYSVTNICTTAVAMQVITVNPLATAGTITGTALVCTGSPASFTDGVSGGVWSSSNTSVATVGTGSGIVSGVAPGTDTIFYSVTNVCNTATAFMLITVNALPSAGTIAGTDSVCEGDTILLSNSVSGGTWSVSNSNASVSTTGLVTGITAGTDTVIYSVTNSCGSSRATRLVTIKSHALCNTGVQPVTMNAAFRVYPNPSGGSFTVEIPETSAQSIITITDVLGRDIIRRAVDAGTQKTVFTLSNVAPGNYFVNVHSGDNIYRAKLVIW